MMTALALAVNGAGVGLLYAAWRRQGRSRRWLAAGGWSLLAASVVPWARESGIEYASVYACLCAAVFAWLWIGWQRATRSPVPDRRPRRPMAMPEAGDIGALAARTGAVLIVAFLASAGIALLLGTQLPAVAANRLFIGLATLLVAWPVIGVWLASTERLARTTTLLLVLTAISGGLLTALQT